MAHLDGVFPFSLAVAYNQVVGLLSVLLGKIVDAQFNAPLAINTLQSFDIRLIYKLGFFQNRFSTIRPSGFFKTLIFFLEFFEILVFLLDFG